jgi:hypothetical protein
MRKRLARILSASSAFATVLIIAITPAHAATTTWTISPGGNWTASLSSNSTLLIDPGPSAPTFTCSSAAMAGNFAAGSGQSGNPLGTITSVSGTCTGPDGNTYTLTSNASSTDPWLLSDPGYASGQTGGELASPASTTGLAVTLTGPSCTVVLGGTTSAASYLFFTYQNSNGLLAIHYYSYHPTIHVVSSTCADWFADEGLHFYTTPILPQGSQPVTGGFEFNPIQTITSP